MAHSAAETLAPDEDWVAKIRGEIDRAVVAVEVGIEQVRHPVHHRVRQLARDDNGGVSTAARVGHGREACATRAAASTAAESLIPYLFS
jgi:hypothetical protein